jgi:glycosyltransferase involved in cell wall biosynthesis
MSNAKHLYLIVPSLQPASPVKGATAICNLLCGYINVTLVPLKTSTLQIQTINKKVDILDLSVFVTWREKYNKFKEALIANGSNKNCISISMGFSADIFNALFSKYTKTVSSIRGNLYYNYRHDYGIIGYLLAFSHYMYMHRFQSVIAISQTLKLQMRKHGIRNIDLIPNFIDEQDLDKHRTQASPVRDCVRFVYLASLSTLKRPFLLVDAIHSILDNGTDVHLDIIGEGRLRKDIEKVIKNLHLNKHVTIHGYLENPYSIIQRCNYLVLPSLSEGISRSIMEGLYYGIPCIARNVGGNKELIMHGKNGFLFNTDDEFKVILQQIAARECEISRSESSLLPESFTQSSVLSRYIKLIDENF